MTTSAADAAIIVQTLEIAAETGDLTGPVYERLFREQPEMKPLFWRDSDNAIKGEMLARVFDAILDFIGERRYADKLIQCEVVTHDGYDVPPHVFATFFGVVGGSVRDACGARWTSDMEAAWDRLLSDLDFYVQNPAHVVASP
ncbi:MAG: globin [Terricaulis sp.]